MLHAPILVCIAVSNDLVDFVTRDEERNDVSNKRPVSDTPQTITYDVAPKRRRSKVDRLVSLLTGTESVSQSHLIVLSVNNTNNNSEDAEEPVIQYVVPKRRPSEVDHLVGLLTGSKSVSQSDLILLNVNKSALDTSDLDTSERLPQ